MRHGEPDYSLVERHAPKYNGHRFDLIHLTSQGEDQIKRQMMDLRAFRPEIVLSSPYPRSLHSAALLSRFLDLDLHVHAGLHEWLPVVNGSVPVCARLSEQMAKAYWEYRETGDAPVDRTWETDRDILNRVLPVLEVYARMHDRLVAVTHEVVIRAVTGRLNTGFGELEIFTFRNAGTTSATPSEA